MTHGGDEPADDTLARSLRTGAPGATDELVACHADAVFDFVLYRVGHRRDVAEDLTQDTLLTALDRIAAFDGRSSLRTWLFGIAKNKVRESLRASGYREAAEGESADLCVVNTCTVTNTGDSKSRQVIRQLAKKNPGSKTIVMGCYATRDPQAVSELPNVIEVVTDKRELPDVLSRFGLVDMPAGISEFEGRQRAFVKIQDGCILKCSYCIIPTVRPGLRSRRPVDIEDEVRRRGRLFTYAVAIAIAIIIELTEYIIVRRARKKTGFDYWLGHKKDCFEARLEISGVLAGGQSQIDSRLQEKLGQMEQSDDTRLPGYAVVVQVPYRQCAHHHVQQGFLAHGRVDVHENLPGKMEGERSGRYYQQPGD